MTNPTHSREHRVASHLLALDVWMENQGDAFSFADVRRAFPGSYEGSFEAVDRRWSRHKAALLACGVALELPDPGAYLVAPAPPSSFLRGPSSARELVEAVRALPPAGAFADEALESGLRKLLLHRAPIAGALLERAARGTVQPRGRATNALELARAARVILDLAQTAGDEGLSLEEVRVLGGVATAADAEEVVRLLVEAEVPLPAPLDALGLDVFGGRLVAYSRYRRRRPLALTGEEHAAVEGLLAWARAEAVPACA